MPHYENDTSQNITTTTETIVMTIPALGGQTAFAQVGQVQAGVPTIISGMINLTPGTSAVTATIRVRQSSLVTGTLVGVALVHEVIATDPQDIEFEVYDSAGSNTGWVVTVQMGSAAATTTVNAVSVDATPQ